MMACIVSLALPLLVPVCDAMADAEYITAAELYAQSRGGWHAVYEAPEHKKFKGVPEDYSFAVDVEIEMPQIDHVPVFDLEINKNVLKDESTSTENYMEGQIREDGSIISNTMYG